MRRVCVCVGGGGRGCGKGCVSKYAPEHVSKHHVTHQVRDNKHRDFLFQEVSRVGKRTH